MACVRVPALRINRTIKPSEMTNIRMGLSPICPHFCCTISIDNGSHQWQFHCPRFAGRAVWRCALRPATRRIPPLCFCWVTPRSCSCRLQNALFNHDLKILSNEKWSFRTLHRCREDGRQKVLAITTIIAYFRLRQVLPRYGTSAVNFQYFIFSSFSRRYPNRVCAVLVDTLNDFVVMKLWREMKISLILYIQAQRELSSDEIYKEVGRKYEIIVVMMPGRTDESFD